MHGRGECTEVHGAEIRVRGLVQGVGFRPTVWRLARDRGVTGTVVNDGEGVLIRAWAAPDTITALTDAIETESPPLARIDAIETRPLSVPPERSDFAIAESAKGAVSTGVVPDAATCDACLTEVFDPKDRRYRYPFTNCTHCGPRLTIIKAIPYDRATTSMAAFAMCPQCRGEYGDPEDRRFHAQPNACPVCGPQVWIEDRAGPINLENTGSIDAIAHAASLLRAGHIVAIKGLGGFHLACDARNAETVQDLRRRKVRDHKPFALMAPALDLIRRFCDVSEAEEALLTSKSAPIVILNKAANGHALPEALAPDQATFGFMLPYTPLHHILLSDFGGPLVMTSGNPADSPQIIDNAAARRALSSIADYWLMHDRDIVNRVDDSVVYAVPTGSAVIRRARGFAPEPLILPDGFEDAPAVLAMGGTLKNTFCQLSAGKAVLSQHIGDLEDVRTHEEYRAQMALFADLFDFSPEVIAVDAHPDYLSTQWGMAQAEEDGIECVPVQHHHAHVAACLAEHGYPIDGPPVLGIVLDGLGYGEDGGLWGGEFLLADYRAFRRLAHFDPVPLPGGMRAMKEPWRNTLAHLQTAFGTDAALAAFQRHGFGSDVSLKATRLLLEASERGVNAPPSSSAGRLFDAAAALIGIAPARMSHEGEAAMALEALAQCASANTGAYPVLIREDRVIVWRPLFEAMLDDLEAGVDRSVIARRFHAGVAAALVNLACHLSRAHRFDTVVLSGGVFQNRLLLRETLHGLHQSGLTPLTHGRVPANDGGLSLGQATIAAARSPNLQTA